MFPSNSDLNRSGTLSGSASNAAATSWKTFSIALASLIAPHAVTGQQVPHSEADIQKQSKTEMSSPAVNFEKAEIQKVFEALISRKTEWKFMTSEEELNLRTKLSELNISEIEAPEIKIRWLPEGLAQLTLTWRSSDAEVISEIAIKELKDKVAAIYADLGKDSVIFRAVLEVDLVPVMEQTEYRKLVILQRPPSRATQAPDIAVAGTATFEQRLDHWNSIFAVCMQASVNRTLLENGCTLSLQPKDGLPAIFQRLTALRDAYMESKMPELAKLCQAIIVQFDSSNPLQKSIYAGIGRISELDLTAAGAPEQIIEMVKLANQSSRATKTPDHFAQIELQSRNVQLPWIWNSLLSIEQDAQIYNSTTVEYARRELVDALRYVKERAAGKEPDLIESAQIIRDYFTKYSGSSYSYGPEDPGFSGRIVSNDHDCSVRALIAFGLMEALGHKPGLEAIGPDLSKQSPGLEQIPQHTYIYVSDETGKRIYFDYCRTTHQQYSFDSNAPIVAEYVGSNPIKTVVNVDTKDPVKIFAQFFDEPIRDQKKLFTAAFAELKLSLNDFLLKRPEYYDYVEKLALFLKAVDKIAPASQLSQKLNRGGYNDIRAIFPELIPALPQH